MKIENKIKKIETKAEIGDVIYAYEDYFLIIKGYIDSKPMYQAIYLTGKDAFNGAGITKDSIEGIVEFFKKSFDDFRLIKSDRVKLVIE